MTRRVASCRGSFALVAAAALSTGVATAQPPSFSETLDVQLLEIDVAVSNRKGEPVSGLTRDDFELRLDGVPVEADHFAEIGGAPPDPLSVVLLVDSRTLRHASRQRAIEQLEPQLEQLLALMKARALVVDYDGELHVIQGWTDDVQEVRDALRRITTRPARGESVHTREANAQRALGDMLGNMRGNSSDRIVAMASIDGLLGELKTYAYHRLRETEGILVALQSVVRSMALTPGRKAVLYVTSGWPVRPAAEAMQRVQSATRGVTSRDLDPTTSRLSQSDASGSTTLGEGIMTRDVSQEFLRGQQSLDALDASAAVDQVIGGANAYRVRFFPIMPPPGDAAAADARARGRGGLEVSDLREGLSRLAESTGGIAFLSETSLVGALDGVARDLQHYYSLALERENGEYEEVTPRELTVKVRGRRAEVRFPSRHDPRSIGGRLLDLALAALDGTAVANPLQIELAMLGQVPSDDGRHALQLALAFPIERIGLAAATGVHYASSQVAVAALGVEGTLTEPQYLEVPLQIPDSDLEKARASFYRAVIQLRLAPGTHRVGVALWDAIVQQASVVVAEVEVTG